MSWTQVTGRVTRGHGVASGQADDGRFPEGTLALQEPLFRQRGLDLAPYHLATLNVSIAPHEFMVKRSRHTFRGVKWSPHEPAEDFSFFDCRVHYGGRRRDGLIYYPHPETKPEHFQDPHVLEVLTAYIPDIAYGDELTLEVESSQIDVQYCAD